MPTKELYVSERAWDIDTQAIIYIAMKACGRADLVFYKGHDLKWFLEEAASGTFLVAILGEEIVGFGMCVDADSNGAGKLSFAFLPGVSVWSAITLSRMMINYLFSTTHYQRLYGFTAEHNRAAVAFAKRVGLQEVAFIPEYISKDVGAIVTYTNKDLWTSKQS